MPRPDTPPALRKALGQHHLVDGALCRPLVDFLQPSGERLLEIGPGGGVLTAELLAAGARRLTAWELDLAWAAELRRRLGDERLRVVVGDALDIAWEQLPGPTLVAGNLPYAIATHLVSDMMSFGGRIVRAGFLVQREVAERLVAAPGDRAYGAQSVLVAAHARVRWLGRVRRGSFRPPPKVEGAFVGFTFRSPPLPQPDMVRLRTLVHMAFGQRRKTLRNALGAGLGKRRAVAALERAGIDPGARAEALGLSEFVALVRAVAGESLHPDGSGGRESR